MLPQPYTLSPTATLALRFLRPLLALTGLTILLTVALYVFSYAPTRTTLSEVLGSYHAARETYHHHQSAKALQLELQNIWAQLPAKTEFTGLGVAIAELAKSNQVEIPGMGYSMERLDNSIATKGELAFEAAGPYEAIRRFIYKVETSRPHLFIEKLTAERAKKGTSVAFKMTVGTFFKPTDGQAPK